MKVSVAIVNAFVDGSNGGNPAGVVLDADELTTDQKQAIAREVGLSETAFVSRSRVAGFKLEFFTPTRQIAHCGHATIATFSYLSQQGLVPEANTSKETIDGIRAIQVNGDFAYMEQLGPGYTQIADQAADVLQALGLDKDSIIMAPMIANTGNSFILVGVKDLQTLKNINPDQRQIEKLSETFDLIGFYVFTLETSQTGRDASTRMFAPRYGIAEESATGMAAGPLACYLHDHLGIVKDAYQIEQGYCMAQPSPSCIHVSLEKKGTDITSLSAGGTGVVSRVIQIEI